MPLWQLACKIGFVASNAGKGRPKGVPNKATTRARNMFAETWQRLTPEIEDWIRRTAEGEPVPLTKKDPATGEVHQVLDQAGNPILVRQGADPGKAADIMMKFAKFHVPELARQELVGKDGGSVSIVVNKLGRE